MSDAKAKVWARRIHAGAHTLEDVPIAYRQKVIDAYFDLYGEELT